MSEAIDVIAKRLCAWEDQLEWTEQSAPVYRQEARFIMRALKAAGFAIVTFAPDVVEITNSTATPDTGAEG